MIDFIDAARGRGTCVLFSTHVLSEAERLCDRIGIIHRGTLLASGTLDELAKLTGQEWLEDIFLALDREAAARAGAPR
jgi:ABC-type Na+ transport system ATPase subunit NatA